MSKMLKDEEAIPFYKQLKEKILDDIEIGKLKHGDKLPSERELADQYGISRMTARSRIVAMSFCEPRSCIGRLSS